MCGQKDPRGRMSGQTPAVVIGQKGNSAEAESLG